MVEVQEKPSFAENQEQERSSEKPQYYGFKVGTKINPFGPVYESGRDQLDEFMIVTNVSGLFARESNWPVRKNTAGEISLYVQVVKIGDESENPNILVGDRGYVVKSTHGGWRVEMSEIPEEGIEEAILDSKDIPFVQSSLPIEITPKEVAAD